MATSQARDRLLAAAVRQALRGGIADLSLRELAAAIGTSHRMLIYHFGSREGLLTAVTRQVEERQRAALLDSVLTIDDARATWRRLSDPSLWPQERLYFELYAHALLGGAWPAEHRRLPGRNRRELGRAAHRGSGGRRR